MRGRGVDFVPMEKDPSNRKRKPYRRPTVTSERVEETVLAVRCKKQPANPSFNCQAAKKFYG